MSSDVPRNRQELTEKIKTEQEVSSWKDLKPYLEQITMILLKPEYGLVEASVEIALDNVDWVKTMIESGALSKPGEDQIQFWDELSDKKFMFTIVRPYILIQEMLN